MTERESLVVQGYRTRLVRTREKIHAPTCPNVKRSKHVIEWNWAERHTDDEWLRFGWLVPCQRCLHDLVVRQDELARRGDLLTDQMAYFASESAE